MECVEQKRLDSRLRQLLRDVSILTTALLVLGSPCDVEAQADTSQIQALLQEALQEASGIANETHRNATLREIAATRAAAGDTPGALAIAASLQDSRAREEFLRAIGIARARVGDRAAASTSSNDEVLYWVAATQASQGNIAEAQRTAGSIGQERLREYVVGVVFKAQLKAGDLAAAEQSARAIVEFMGRNHALASVAVAHAAAGDLRSALDLLPAFIGTHEKADAFRGILVETARRGAVGEALAVAIDKRRDEIRLPSAEETAALRKLGVGSEVDRIVAERRQLEAAAAQARAGHVHGVLTIISAKTEYSELQAIVRAIASARAEAGDVRGALDIVATIGDPFSRSAPLRDIAIAQARDGDVATAFKTLADITIVRDRDEALVGIARIQGQRGDLSTARSAANTIQDYGLQSLAIREGIVDVQLKDGDIAGALHTMMSMSYGRCPVTYHNIAVAQARSGDTDAAIQTASSCGDYEPTLRDVLVIFAEQGDLGAINKAIPRQSERWKASTVRRVTTALAKAGYDGPARQWARAQPSPLTRSFGFLGVADGILHRSVPSHEIP